MPKIGGQNRPLFTKNSSPCVTFLRVGTCCDFARERVVNEAWVRGTRGAPHYLLPQPLYPLSPASSHIIFFYSSFRAPLPSFAFFTSYNMPKPLPEPKEADDHRYFSVCHPYPNRPDMEKHDERVAFAWWISCIMGGPESFIALFHRPTVRHVYIRLSISPYLPVIGISLFHAIALFHT